MKSEKGYFKEILAEIEDMFAIVQNSKWRSTSITRQKILIRAKIDTIKQKMVNYTLENLISSEAYSTFFEKILQKFTELQSFLDKDEMSIEWYQLELFRLRFASMYANLWGDAGNLHIAGTAHALAQVLMGIETLDVEHLLVDWTHPEFEKRRNMIMNYLSSAMLFFFSLCSTLYSIYDHDLIHWLEEGFKATAQFLQYVDVFWNIPKIIGLEQRLNKRHNYSIYGATFTGFDQIITFLISNQRYLYEQPVKKAIPSNIVNVSTPDEFFSSIFKLFNQFQKYIDDLKGHIEKGTFDINDDPLNKPELKETLLQLQLSKVVVKGYKIGYDFHIKEETDRIDDLEREVIAVLDKFLSRFTEMMKNPAFISSQIADALRQILELLIFFKGIIALNQLDYKSLLELECKYACFFSDAGIKRYPSLNGQLQMIKLTIDLKKENFKDMLVYSDIFLLLADTIQYQSREIISFYLLGNLIQLIESKLTRDDFIMKMKKKTEEIMFSLPQTLESEVDIYLRNLEVALRNQPVKYNITRLVAQEYYDIFSVFIPDISNYAETKGYHDVIYLPFNLQKDYLIRKREQ